MRNYITNNTQFPIYMTPLVIALFQHINAAVVVRIFTHVVMVSCRLTIHVFQLHYLLSATSAVTHFSIREDGQCVLCIAILFPTGNAFVLHDNLSDPFGCSGVYGQKKKFPPGQMPQGKQLQLN